MSFGSILYKEFLRNVATKSKHDEVALFTALASSFGTASCCKADIIHGTKYSVEFDYPSKKIIINTCKPKSLLCCEPADILFIVFGDPSEPMRLCFLQNKVGINKSRVKGANLKQLVLLHDRPILNTTHKKPYCIFADPEIFSNAILPSIGAYGVFYSNTTGCYDMSFWSADKVEPKNTLGSLYRDINFVGTFGSVNHLKGYDYCTGLSTIEEFGNNLINLLVGTPISREMPLWSAMDEFLYTNSNVYRGSAYASQNSLVNPREDEPGRDKDFVSGFPKYVVAIDANTYDRMKNRQQ